MWELLHMWYLLNMWVLQAYTTYPLFSNYTGCPEVVCSDCGTENVVMAALQTLFHEADDSDNPLHGHRYCTSPRNQVIVSLVG